MFRLLANANTIGTSVITVVSSFQSRTARGKDEILWCFDLSGEFVVSSVCAMSVIERHIFYVCHVLCVT